MTPDTSGPTWRVPLAHYDPALSSWRTSQGMFPSDWPTSSETCPRWGMTRRGELFELPTPALPTDAPASSSLPTPRATRGGSHTETIALLMPTPRTTDGNGAGAHGDGGPDLRTVVALLPTPDTGESLTGHGRRGGKPGNGSQSGASLESTVRLLPTPSAADAMGGHLTRSGSRSDELLLPGVAKALANGDLTAPPSPDGKPSSDDPHPHQLSLDATTDPD